MTGYELLLGAAQQIGQKGHEGIMHRCFCELLSFDTPMPEHNEAFRKLVWDQYAKVEDEYISITCRYRTMPGERL